MRENKGNEPAYLLEHKAWKNKDGERMGIALVSQGTFLRIFCNDTSQWQCIETTLGDVIRAVAVYTDAEKNFGNVARKLGYKEDRWAVLSKLPAMTARESGILEGGGLLYAEDPEEGEGKEISYLPPSDLECPDWDWRPWGDGGHEA